MILLELHAIKPKGYFTLTEWVNRYPPTTVELTIEEQQAAFTSAIQLHLDAFAQSRGYDNIFTATTYATSKDPQFASEGQYAVEARDITWRKAYDILGAVLSGQRPMPTLDEVMAELPVLSWPEL